MIHLAPPKISLRIARTVSIHEPMVLTCFLSTLLKDGEFQRGHAQLWAYMARCVKVKKVKRLNSCSLQPPKNHRTTYTPLPIDRSHFLFDSLHRGMGSINREGSVGDLSFILPNEAAFKAMLMNTRDPHVACRTIPPPEKLEKRMD